MSQTEIEALDAEIDSYEQTRIEELETLEAEWDARIKSFKRACRLKNLGDLATEGPEAKFIQELQKENEMKLEKAKNEAEQEKKSNLVAYRSECQRKVLDKQKAVET